MRNHNMAGMTKSPNTDESHMRRTLQQNMVKTIWRLTPRQTCGQRKICQIFRPSLIIQNHYFLKINKIIKIQVYVLNCEVLGQKFVFYHVNESIDVGRSSARSTEIKTSVNRPFCPDSLDWTLVQTIMTMRQLPD